MTRIEELEKRIEIIEERNRRVETDKAWPSLRIYGFAQTAYSAVSRAGYFGGQGDE